MGRGPVIPEKTKETAKAYKFGYNAGYKTGARKAFRLLEEFARSRGSCEETEEKIAQQGDVY